MAWQPQEDALRQLCELFKDSLQGHQPEKQQRATETIQQASNNQDYINYLTLIFSNAQLNSQFLVRFQAGIQLKNFIKTRYPQISKDQLDFVKTATVQTLRDLNPQLRNFAGTVITEVVQQGGILTWPEVLQELLALVADTSGNVAQDTQEAAMAALAKVCDDNRKLLDREYSGQRPTTVLIPKLLDFAGHSNPKIRVLAVETLKGFITQKSHVMFSMLDLYLQKIFQLASDSEISVRRSVCQSLVQLVELKPEMIAPHMQGLVDYILAQQQTLSDPSLALDAAEFWLSVGEQERLRELMGPYLVRVVPVLLAGMVYGEEDTLRLAGDEENANQEDRPEEVKPKFAQTRAGRGNIVQVKDDDEDGISNGATPSKKADLSDGEIEDSDDDSDWDDDEDPEDAWSLRKCSAAALDVFAVNYNDSVFDIILPYLKENLSHSLWPKREAAVLALGAVAEGCLPVVAPHLPELVPFLISLLNDEEPAVRQITCWCLSRYSEWAAHLSDPVQISKYFEPMMEGLLQRMLDKNKKVQEAGASSFASLEEKAADKLKPYVEPILRQFTLCFQRYKDKNIHILYDCLQTLADNVGSEMATPPLVDLLMPVLIARWNTIADDSREMFPLLGCLSFVAMAYGETFGQFAEPIFTRCMKLIYSNLQQHIAFTTGASPDEPDKDFIMSALDLLSAIIQAIPPTTSTQLVLSTQPQFYDLLSFCMEDPTSDVRQSAYALLGDCAITLFPTLEPALPKLLPIAIRQLDLDLIPSTDDTDLSFNVLINVCWSLGEIAVRAPNAVLSPYIQNLYQGIIEIVRNEEVPDAATENAAMALGRLGFSCPDEMSSHLGELAEPFLSSMGRIAATEEKASAFLGFNELVKRNPKAMEGCLGDYFVAVAGFPIKPGFSEVRQSFGVVIEGYRGLIGGEFGGFLGTLNAKVRERLREGYGVQ